LKDIEDLTIERN